jgi:nucleotide-binding universal stress UspA family protein
LRGIAYLRSGLLGENRVDTEGSTMGATLADINSAPLTGGRGVFSRVLVGIDGSVESREAARQAALLEDVDGELTLFAAWDVTSPLLMPTGAAGPFALFEMRRREAEQALSEAFREVAAYASPTTKMVRGLGSQGLIDEINREQDTLVAIGSHGTGRLSGILTGSTATELIHNSPCSVLIARKASKHFPRQIVVGVDGSPESAAAYAAARYLAKRFDAELRPRVASGDDRVDERLVAMILGEHHEELAGDPVDLLINAAATADLLVVGSRGLRGMRALGSVSERVSHEAPCSTLIVREPVWQRVRDELAL